MKLKVGIARFLCFLTVLVLSADFAYSTNLGHGNLAVNANQQKTIGNASDHLWIDAIEIEDSEVEEDVDDVDDLKYILYSESSALIFSLYSDFNSRSAHHFSNKTEAADLRIWLLYRNIRI